MNKLNLALKTTNWCNLNCRHCCECSGSSVALNLMPLTDVENYIHQFRNLQVPKWEHLVFTGGESMAPYYHNITDYVPKCLDLAYNNGFVPFFKTNGMWGGNLKLCQKILTDLASAAYKYQCLASLDISVDEFHNNIAQTVNIIKTIICDTILRPAIRISLVGLNTDESKWRFVELVSQLVAHDLHFRPLDSKTMIISYQNVAMQIYFDFAAPLTAAGRALNNNLSTVHPTGMPDDDTGSCLQVDNDKIATLNYKWRESVANQSIEDAVKKLFAKMNSHSY